jgi:hypothetical protein
VVLAVEYWSPKILQLLLQPKFGLRTSGVACQRPTVEAMSVNRAEALEMLLDYYTAPLSESRFLLAEGLQEAWRSGRIDSSLSSLTTEPTSMRRSTTLGTFSNHDVWRMPAGKARWE